MRASARLLARFLPGGPTAIDEQGRARNKRRRIGGQIQHGADYLVGRANTPHRDAPQDLLAMSHVKGYNGYYFVLGGALSPLDAVGPSDLRINELINRLKKDKIIELIIATDTDSKGETTALYLAEQIKPLGIKVTRLGYGLPVGGDLEYADEVTLSRAIEGRREM
jgi:uncharacterized protein (UPF0297 family)